MKRDKNDEQLAMEKMMARLRDKADEKEYRCRRSLGRLLDRIDGARLENEGMDEDLGVCLVAIRLRLTNMLEARGWEVTASIRGWRVARKKGKA